MKIIGIREQFFKRLRQGEHQAMLQVYEEAFDYCASHILKNSGNIEDAKDIFQEVLLVFLKKLKDENFVIEHDLKAYLYKITKNLWLKRLNAHKKNGLYLVLDEPTSKINPAEEDTQTANKEKEERHQKLRQALQQLGAACKQLLHYTFFDKRSNQEIADMMGYSSNNFISQKRIRCIRQLKAKMV